MKRIGFTGIALSLICAVVALAAAGASAKGLGWMSSPSGIALPGSPFRYIAISPGVPDRLTVVARVNRHGGVVRRWWQLPGGFFVPAVAFDGTAGGLSADGSTLILSHRKADPEAVPQLTTLAIMDTGRPARPVYGDPRDPFVHYMRLKGEWALLALSPDGGTAYVTHYLTEVEQIRPGLYRPLHPGSPLEVRALDTSTGRLLRGPVLDRDGERSRIDGIAYAQAGSRDGSRTYTLYADERRGASVYALDSVRGRGTRIDLPLPRPLRESYSVHLELRDGGRSLRVFRRWFPGGERRERTLARIDTGSFEVSGARPRPTSERPVYGLWRRSVGHSAEGREIRLVDTGNMSLTGRLLVFGCTHGDECAGAKLLPLSNGCPDPESRIFLVPNLDPDGIATGTRLNGHGVDLNRNFPVAWKPRGERGDPEYSGPRPFSEPESRLAARIVEQLKPTVTVWFHQHLGRGAFVRAWGQSAPAGRRFAALAGIRFRLLPWLAGTAPNWQNHRHPGTASFVVELPAGTLPEALKRRLELTLLRIGREVGED